MHYRPGRLLPLPVRNFPMLDNADQDYASDRERFELLEQRLGNKTEFPIYMVFPFLTVALAMAAILMFPPASGYAIAGFIHLNIICYGIINDMLAVRNCIEYFRFGHQEGQLDEVCIPSTNKEAQAFHWGVLATWLLSAIGAGIIGFIASVAAPVTPLFYPLLSMLVIGALISANKFSKTSMQNYVHELNVPSIPSYDMEVNKNWHRCGYRNGFGYATLPLMGVAIGIGVATSAFNGLATILPSVLLPLARPLMPVILAAPMMLFVGGMFVNYLRHRNTIEPDQTLPRKFGTNPNFMRDASLLETTPGPRPSHQMEPNAAPFVPLHGVHNARSQKAMAQERAPIDDGIRVSDRPSGLANTMSA